MMDSSTHWHGFTPMADHATLEIASAEGCYLHTTDGRTLIDGVSNLWCNVHGHRHPVIDEAIRRQLDRVAHVTTLGMAADTTNRLADLLAKITPGDLRHTFFSSDGSSAVEAAIKIALQYWRQTQPSRPSRTRYIALSGAYHGDTAGSVSLGGIETFHDIFGPLLFEPLRGPLPCTYRLPEGIMLADAAAHYARHIERLLKEHQDHIAAVVIEPMVQGAVGMVTHPAGFLYRVRKLCEQYDVLMIADEVAVGFGRTGTLFACENEHVTPDLMCLGKGLTGGYLPLAATVARPHVFEAFLGAASENRQFFHGHTFGGNPLAAAAAIASIGLFQGMDIGATVHDRAGMLREGLRSLDRHPHVGNIRGRGLMFGIELVADRDTRRGFQPAHRIGRRVCEAAIERGVWLRPLGDVVVVMPPLCVEESEICQIADAVVQSIDAVLPRGSTT